jgi:hypothetical protein
MHKENVCLITYLISVGDVNGQLDFPIFSENKCTTPYQILEISQNLLPFKNNLLSIYQLSEYAFR